MITPMHATDEQIAALHELEHEQAFLISMPAQDWQLDVSEEGAVLGTCPICAYRGALLSTRDQRVQCCECSHIDGTETVRVGASNESPGELLDVLSRDPDLYSDEE